MGILGLFLGFGILLSFGGFYRRVFIVCIYVCTYVPGSRETREFSLL